MLPFIRARTHDTRTAMLWLLTAHRKGRVSLIATAKVAGSNVNLMVERKKTGSISNPKRSEKIPCERCGKHGHGKTACPNRICTKCGGRAHDATTCTSMFLTTVQSGKEEIKTEANPSHITVESTTSCGNDERYALLVATEDSPSSNAPGKYGANECLVSSVGVGREREEWILDSAASCHVTSMITHMTNYKPCVGNESVVTASQNSFASLVMVI
ncbi:unnamed protein product [Choristocarpus tenellus]